MERRAILLVVLGAALGIMLALAALELRDRFVAPHPLGQVTVVPVSATMEFQRPGQEVPLGVPPGEGSPENMVPGVPVFGLFQVNNDSQMRLAAAMKAELQEDGGLCNALVSEVGLREHPEALFDGALQELQARGSRQFTVAERSQGVVMISVSLPREAGNEYQGTSCTVQFTLNVTALAR